jgi:GAF domain-containing protein
MRGRSRTGLVKSRRRKPAAPKRAGGTAVARPRGSSAAGQQGESVQLRRELQEALDRQIATADVLSIVASSPGNAQPVFEMIARSVASLCKAQFCYVFRFDGELVHFAAQHGYASTPKNFLTGYPLPPGRTSAATRSILSGAIEQIPDVTNDPDYGHRAHAKDLKYRSIVAVPMLKNGRPLGTIAVARSEPGKFPDWQIDLLRTFADQAVIAIENARLLNELRESLERQTATSEILSVISRSQGELQPVFETMLANAVRVCDANSGAIYRWENDAMHLVATHKVAPAYAEALARAPLRITPKGFLVRLVATKSVVQIADLAREQAYIDRNPMTVMAVEVAHMRTMLLVPLLKENELIGGITLYRVDVRPFSDQHTELVQNFAAQAVIAIENARLLNELRQRTADLSETLEQQTATSEVLKVISSSPGELEPVFRSILQNATRICEASIGILFRFEDGAYTAFATLGVTPEYNEYLSRGPIRAGPGTGLGRVAAGKQTIHVIDTQAEQTYADREPLRVATAELGGARTLLNVPMLKEGELIGAIGIYRQEVRPFTDKQIELVTNFAAQAVIAIENARLLSELRQRTEQIAKLNQQLEQRVADQVGEIERMSRLRRFLPPQVADLIVASGAEKQLESHRREITALFCDLRGFTGFSESSDPEDVMALLRDYHAAIGKIIIKYSGTLERYAGDGVMVVFNDPVPVENPAMQAVLMALEMRETIGALIEKWKRLGHDLGFGIGVAHGFATLGTIGFEGRFDYAAIGTVSNVASRLCDEAKPGQILISPRVLMAVEDVVTTETVGEFTLKGIRRPMAAYNVLAPSSSKPN